MHELNSRHKTQITRHFAFDAGASAYICSDQMISQQTDSEAEERDDVRELIFQGYRIIYLRQENHVYIVTVVHGSRDLSDMENKPWNKR